MNSAISDKELNDLINNWWWLVFFVPTILGACSEAVRDFFHELTMSREDRDELRHQRALELEKARSTAPTERVDVRPRMRDEALAELGKLYSSGQIDREDFLQRKIEIAELYEGLDE